MGLTVYLNIVQQSSDFAVDVTAANADLIANSGFAELFEEELTNPQFKGVFQLSPKGELLLAQTTDKCFEGDYEKGWCMVYGCVGAQEFDILAKYVTAGNVVFELDIEGNTNQYYKVTPGKSTLTRPSF